MKAKKRNMIVYGPPGTGKSMLLAYLFIQRLSEKRPVLLQSAGVSIIAFENHNGEAKTCKFRAKSADGILVEMEHENYQISDIWLCDMQVLMN